MVTEALGVKKYSFQATQWQRKISAAIQHAIQCYIVQHANNSKLAVVSNEAMEWMSFKIKSEKMVLLRVRIKVRTY